MIALVTILFAFSWLPIHIIYLLLKFWPGFPKYNKSLYALKMIAHTLTYTNSMLNPFLYTIMGNKFRKSLASCCTKQDNRLSCNTHEMVSLKQDNRLSCNTHEMVSLHSKNFGNQKVHS